MNNLQSKILKMLWNYYTLREEHVLQVMDCKKEDIEYLIANRLITRDNKTNILQHKLRQVNNRSVAAFDVVLKRLDKTTDIKKGKKFPIILSFKIGKDKYDVIVVKKDEVEKLYEGLEELSSADKVYIVILADKYIKRHINTTKKCLICTYSPLQQVDTINI